MNVDVNVIGLYGLAYIVFMMGFLSLSRRLRKQRVDLRSISTQAVLGGVIFMASYGFLEGINE